LIFKGLQNDVDQGAARDKQVVWGVLEWEHGTKANKWNETFGDSQVSQRAPRSCQWSDRIGQRLRDQSIPSDGHLITKTLMIKSLAIPDVLTSVTLFSIPIEVLSRPETSSKIDKRELRAFDRPMASYTRSPSFPTEVSSSETRRASPTLGLHQRW
jgi:hypothetical protein